MKLLVIAFVVKPAPRQRFGLAPDISQWLASLVAGRPTVAACLGAPQGLERIAQAGARICTDSDVAASQVALVEALAG